MYAWLDFQGHSEPSERRIVDALAQAGVSTRPLACGAIANPGIVVFSEISHDLCDALRELSQNGLNRILAIARSAEALHEGAGWRLLHAGAADVFAWDHSAAPALQVAGRLARWKIIDEHVEAPSVRGRLIGDSPIWKRVLRDTVEAACFSDASVLVLGETGTGKELIARLVHELDARPKKTGLVLLDCTTIVPELSGSEFFGHERGAFTHAVAGRDGAFALSNGGTLFLDEVGELPLSLQAQLLRVTQERVYKRVGGNAWQSTEFRLLCATNRDLTEAVCEGRFRSDLYYRISARTLTLPPLRDRAEDILPLARHFIAQCRPDRPAPELDPAVQAFLLGRDYPGNIRELRQVVERLMARHTGGGPITLGDVAECDRPADGQEPFDWRDEAFDLAIRRALAQGLGLKAIGRAAEDTAIRIALGDAQGNLRRAARRLDVTDRALQMRRAAGRL